MWLIDENLDVRLHLVLAKFGITAHSAKHAGLAGFSNRKLLKAAQRLGYSAILTRDFLYAANSGFSQGSHPQIAILVIELSVPQQQLLDWFESQFRTKPISPTSGHVTTWP